MTDRFIAILPFREVPTLDIDLLTQAMRGVAASMPLKVEPLKDGAYPPGRLGASLSVNGVPISVLLVSTPFPRAGYIEAMRAPGLAQIWPDAAEEIKTEKAHFAIATLGGDRYPGHEQAMAAAVALSIVAGAIAQSADCIGVYWRTAESLTRADMFRKKIAGLFRGLQFPIDVWLRLDFLPLDPEGTATRTTGLRPFVGREVEISRSGRPLSETASAAYHIANHLILKGPVFRDGDTVDAGGVMRVSLANSTSTPSVPVFGLAPAAA